MRFRVTLTVQAGLYDLKRDETIEAKDVGEAMNRVFAVLPDPPLESVESFDIHLSVKAVK